ncbi:MAG: DUF502 domain-containing protein [Gammaproteobacteria bacterium]
MPTLRRYIIAGLVIWLPLGVTVLVIKLLVDTMDKIILLLPQQYRPDVLLGFHIPGLGVVLSVAIVLITGVIVANFFGKQLVGLWESFLAKIPLVRTIYASVKQVAVTIFSEKGESFRKVLLIEYPRKGIYTVAFHTGSVFEEVQEKTGAEVLNVFVPTTPNPTSGFFIMVPKQEVIELSMTVDEAIKLIMSLGVVVPEKQQDKLAQLAKNQSNP